MKESQQRTSNKNFLDAFANSLNGIWYTIKTQKNIKIQIVIALIVVIAAVAFKFTAIEYIFLTFACFLVFITEIVNTAIEVTINLITEKYHPLAKIAKDVGAGSVLVASLNAIIVGCILFLGKMF